jgi:chromosome segregation ATPase
MSEKKRKTGGSRKILLCLLFLSVGLATGLGINFYRLHQERTAHHAEITKAEGQIKLLQKKYQEAKNRSDSLLRTKYLIEGERKNLREELDRVKEELVALEKTEKGRVRALEAKTTGLEKKLAEAGERSRHLSDKLQETATALDTTRTELAKTRQERDNYQADLAAADRNLKRCDAYNRELYDTSKAILDHYQGKDFFTNIMEKEKFTGLMRVELEHQAQEYEEIIEKNRFTGGGP